jgi:hypothetical protein
MGKENDRGVGIVNKNITDIYISYINRRFIEFMKKELSKGPYVIRAEDWNKSIRESEEDWKKTREELGLGE